MGDAVAVRPVALGLLLAWLALELAMLSQHALFRDETRALSLALQGDTIFHTATGVRDGHPPLWHLMLRAAYSVSGSYAVVSIVSLAAAAAAVALLMFRSPFGWPLLLLILLSRFALFDYSVLARNYGISMLLMFLFASLYEAHRRRGLVLGIVLFLLCMSNVHSVILVAGFLLFWLVDVLQEQGIRRTPQTTTFVVNAAIAVLGVIACAASVYPPVHDAATTSWEHGNNPLLFLKVALSPGARFNESIIVPVLTLVSDLGLGRIDTESGLTALVLSVLMFAATLGLLRAPGAFLAACATLSGFSLLFILVYGASYRHEALWIVFLITMYWLQGQRQESFAPPRLWPRGRELELLTRIGWCAFIALLLLQAIEGLRASRAAFDTAQPRSQSRNLADFVRSRPDLSDAIIMGDPDYLTEALPSYLDNRIYMPREGDFGHIAMFRREGRLSLSVGDLLADAQRLSETHDRPVVLLIREKLDPMAPARVVKEAYNWELRIEPTDVVALLAAAEHVGRFEPSQTDEFFDAYVINPLNPPPN